MAKLPIDKIFILGFLSDERKILDLIERVGAIQVVDKNIDFDELRHESNSENILSFDKNVRNCDQVLEIFDEYDKEKVGLLASLDGPKKIGLAEFENKSKITDEVISKVEHILDIYKDISDNEATINKYEQEIESLRPWEMYDAPLSLDKTEDTFLYVGSIKGEYGYEDLYAKIITNFDHTVSDYIDIEILNKDKLYTNFRVVVYKDYKDIVEDALKKIGFTRAPFTKLLPREEIRAIDEKIDILKKDIVSSKDKIRSFTSIREDIKFTRDFMAMSEAREELGEKINISESVFFIEGYIPKKVESYLIDKLNKNFECYVDIKEPAEDEDVPVLLHNNPFSEPMESVVDSYSLPNDKEFDPSIIISIFYYIFFGMMLSDAGYGILLSLGTGIVLLACKNMGDEMKKMMKLFFFSGLSTIFWGIMFGSFFGDAIDVIGHVYFNVPENIQILKPIWFEPIKEPMRLLVFAFLLGIIHLFTGLFIKFYLCIKNGDIKSAIFDVVFWFMFVGGGIIYLLTMPMITNMLGIADTVNMPDFMGLVSAIVAILGAIGVLLTDGRSSKNIIKRLLKGAYAVYGVSGWLSDVLSYSRILALGLATGAIAQVINQMGSMLDIPIVGVIVFIIVFVAGHIMNLGINVLGSYVHTNRLQFVEFFGKFYEGGGKKFVPFKINTKYYYVEEEN